jgi:aspartate aminotransferase-like enzyme
MVIKRYLMAPGPTPVPERILLRMAMPMIHHRTPEFSDVLRATALELKSLFQTQNDVLILASSGTGAMEAAVSNLFSPMEKVLVVNGGKFGERWLQICESYALRALELKVEWGKAVQPADVEKTLQEHPEIKAVLIQASETSTTVLHPTREIAELTQKRQALLIVDGVTAVGVVDLPMDDWGIDVLVTGSQKALMLPPGLAFISLGERAWSRVSKAKLPRYYFDLSRERKSLAEHTTAYTPAVSLILGLHEALKMIKEEGLPQVFARHELLARATRAAALGLGLKLLSPKNPSPAATGIWLPTGMDGEKLLDYLRDRVGMTFAEGQDHLKGKIIRISHLGYVGPFDILAALCALELALDRFGYPNAFGRGVKAAEEVLKSSFEPGGGNEP